MISTIRYQAVGKTEISQSSRRTIDLILHFLNVHVSFNLIDLILYEISEAK